MSGATHERLELAARARRMRENGMLYRQIQDALGISRSYAQALVNDPDGEKQRARKDSYRGRCEKCGKRTDGSNGREAAPKVCKDCYREVVTLPCGTYAAYSRGCSCDACREANRASAAKIRGKAPPRHGTNSAYSNYKCRCDACLRAHRDHEWLDGYKWKRAWAEKQKLPCVHCGRPRYHKAKTGMCLKCERSTRAERQRSAA